MQLSTANCFSPEHLSCVRAIACVLFGQRAILTRATAVSIAHRIVMLGIGLMGLFADGAKQATAQPTTTRRTHRTVSVPEMDPGRAIRLREYIGAEQWQQAADELEAMLRATESDWVLRSESQQGQGWYRRFISSHEYAQQWLSVAPDPLLDVYRRRANSTVERWWNDAGSGREATAKRVVRYALFSDRGEEALRWLATAHVERGEFAEADLLLERLTSTSRLTDADARFVSGYPAGPIWLAWRDVPVDERDATMLQSMTQLSTSLPDVARLRSPQVSAAEVWAQRIWLAIQRGDDEQARVELDILRTIAPQSRGRLLGQEGDWVEMLTALLERKQRAVTSPGALRDTSQDWPQLAHDLQHLNRATLELADGLPDLTGDPAWWIQLSPRVGEGDQGAPTHSADAMRHDSAPISFPIVVGETVLLQQRDALRALDVLTGEPRWPLGDETDEDPGRSGLFWETPSLERSELPGENDRGIAVHTLSSAGDLLFARVGSPITSSRDPDDSSSAQLVAMHGRAEARLLSGFPMTLETGRVRLSGCPISDGEALYVVLRKSSEDSGRVAYSIASYQLVASGANSSLRLKWERALCESETGTPAGGSDRTQEFLALADGVLYVNSNAGVIAAFTADFGTPLWLMEYPRPITEAKQPQLPRQRFANPCVVTSDLVVVAPSDTEDVIALDRLTGALVWQHRLPGVDAIVGVTREHVIGSGIGLIWLGRYDGVEYASFPRRIARGSDSGADRLPPHGWGRAVHTPPFVIWPTRDELFWFYDAPRSVQGADRRTWYEPVLARRVNLKVRGAEGGNLVLTHQMLLIAGKDRLWAFPLLAADKELDTTEQPAASVED